jgi:hypothetical protein
MRTLHHSSVAENRGSGVEGQGGGGSGPPACRTACPGGHYAGWRARWRGAAHSATCSSSHAGSRTHPQRGPCRRRAPHCRTVVIWLRRGPLRRGGQGTRATGSGYLLTPRRTTHRRPVGATPTRGLFHSRGDAGLNGGGKRSSGARGGRRSGAGWRGAYAERVRGRWGRGQGKGRRGAAPDWGALERGALVSRGGPSSEGSSVSLRL